jgi:hypothetical protein
MGTDYESKLVIGWKVDDDDKVLPEGLYYVHACYRYDCDIEYYISIVQETQDNIHLKDLLNLRLSDDAINFLKELGLDHTNPQIYSLLHKH